MKMMLWALQLEEDREHGLKRLEDYIDGMKKYHIFIYTYLSIYENIESYIYSNQTQKLSHEWADPQSSSIFLPVTKHDLRFSLNYPSQHLTI